ncbi:hypothetical protein D3C85_1836190 [compost metagenome]
MAVRVPSSSIITSFASFASPMLRRKGGASDSGMVGGFEGCRLCMTVLATCSSLIATPSEKYCSGDQLMSMLSAVITLSGLR